MSTAAEKQENFIRETIMRMAELSLIDEVLTTPKPGLVDTHDQGAHKDMSVDTFVVSAHAIAPYIADMFLCGWKWGKGADSLFSAIVPMGVEAEKAMFLATNGVNTHKGAIFTMGILSAAAGYSHAEKAKSKLNEQLNPDPSADAVFFSESESREYPAGDELVLRIQSVLRISGEMMRTPMEEAFCRMQKKVPETHGEKLFARYGERGIRGEAQLGFPVIREIALPSFSSYMNKYRPTGEILRDSIQNAIHVNVLLQIMTKLSDTCVLSRGDQESLSWIQAKAAEVSALGGAFTEAGTEAIVSWNQECIERNISPGGAADILSVTLFLWRLEREAIV